MIKNVYWLAAPGLQPYVNQGLEKALVDLALPGELILYLWQNQRTVVLGRHQNPWRECDLDRLEQDGGWLARRISGGGAVYHDQDNLNFSFILSREDYDLPRQQKIVLQALRGLGLAAELSGRNDVLAAGRKLSGHAFWQGKSACLHHGTLLLQADGARMSAYLRPSAQKLAAKGVASVASRVAGMRDFLPGLSLDQVKTALIETAGQVWQVPARPFDQQRLDQGVLDKNQAFFADPAWRLAQPTPGNWYRERRFPWGELQLSLDIREQSISRVQVYTDALDESLPEGIIQALSGCPWPPPQAELARRLHELKIGAELLSLLIGENMEETAHGK